MSKQTSIIKVEGLRRTFIVGSEEVHALKGVSFEIHQGEFVSIMGSSGSGKSTLLNILGCLDQPTSGEYLIDGISVRERSKNELSDIRNRKIGFVFQSYNLLPRTSALENVELPLVYNPDISHRERHERAQHALELVGLKDRMDHMPNQLSGGQQQRVAIARALVNDPVIVLADEATGNLDTRTSYEIMSLFQSLHEQGKTIAFVTHESDIAVFTSRTIFLRDGHILRDEKVATKSAAEALAALPKITIIDMDILNLIRISAKALLRNKTRTALSMLGIVIGIAAVIAVVNLGEGLKVSTANQLSDMGTNLIMVMRANQRRGGISMGSSSVESLTITDCELIAKNAKNVTMVSPVVNSAGQIVNGSKNWSGTVYGGSPDYLEIRKYDIATGVNFTEEDVKKYAKVGLIGQTIVEELFEDGEDPIGKTIRIGNMPFMVIGTLKEKGENAMGMDQDDIVIMPYSTVQKRMLGINYIQQIVCSAASESVSDAAVEEIENILRTSHKIPTGGENDFEVRTQQEMLEMMTSMTGMITTVLIAIALISLLVGCIGIMNIMYVTVTERTKEIGLRMSIGAKNAAILMQFLTESIILSLIGGVIGLLLGIGLSYVVATVMSLPFVINPVWMVISFVSCAILGLIAGFFPALKASRTDPINALRYE